MTAAVTAAGVVVAVGDLSLVIISWRSQTALAGVLGATGVPVVALAIARGARGQVSEYAIVLAAVLLGIGIVLYALGQALQRMLEDGPDDEA